MDIQNNLIDIDWLQTIKGAKLIKVKALSFFLTNSESESNGDGSIEAIHLEFEGFGFGKLFCGPDGTSICLDHEPFRKTVLDTYGAEKIIDLESREFWRNIINVEIFSIKLIRSELEDCVFAISFLFKNDYEIVVANIGDDLVYKPNLHANILTEEKATFVTIGHTDEGNQQLPR